LATAKKQSTKPNARRSQNTEAVLDVVRTLGPSSQATIARQSKLSAATISSIVKDLESQGLVDLQPINGRETMVSLTTSKGVFIVAELGNSSIEAVAYSFTGKFKRSKTIDGGDNPKALGDLIDRLLDEAKLKRSDIYGIALAVQAPIHRDTHSIAKWTNLRMQGWAGVNLHEFASKAFPGIPVVVENDSNLAALAEWTWGVGRGCDHFLYVRATAGVGGGIIINGQIYHGGNGMAGDIGHLALEGNGEVCYCGSRGCLSTLISRQKIIDAVKDLPGNRNSIPEIVAAAETGDAASQRVLAEAGQHLGRGLANVLKILAPSIVAIGGELGQAGHYVFDNLASSVELVNSLANDERMPIVPAEINGNAALLGGLAAVLSLTGKGISHLPEWVTE
jgi:predicted NBD/HSP70 family sugar kinase